MHTYSHLNNVYICKYAGYLSIMLSIMLNVTVHWCPFPILEIFRFIVPDFNYIWPWDRISCHMHVFSTKSIWKGEKSLDHTQRNLEIYYNDILFIFILQIFRWSSKQCLFFFFKQCLIKESKLSCVSAGIHLSHWWVNFWYLNLVRSWQQEMMCKLGNQVNISVSATSKLLRRMNPIQVAYGL